MRLIDADAFWKPFEDEKEELEKSAIKTSSNLTALKIIDLIKKRLDEQPTIVQPEWKNGNWIQCQVMLPEVGQSVLLSVAGMYTAEGCLRDDGNWFQFRWEKIQRQDMVGAWMPLPEPYGGESE